MGQIILVRKNFPFDVQCVFKNDRILTVRIVLSNNEMYVTNVYAPTISSDKGTFLYNLYEHINTLNTVYQTVCGDFNCVLDNELDIISGDQHNARDVNQLNDFVLKSELNDAWRLFSAEQKAYMVEEKPFHSTETGLYIVDRHHSQ